MRTALIQVLVFLAASVSAPAVSMVVSNASFEFPALPAGEATYAGGPLQFSPEQSFAIPGWGGTLGYAPGGTLLVSTGVRNGTNAVDGTQTLYLEAHVQAPGFLATIWQDVGEVSPNTTYTLTVAAGGPLSGVPDGATGFINLMLNSWEGTALASATFTPFGNMSGLSDYHITCKTSPTATGRLVIALGFTALPGPYPYEVNFDHVRLDAAIPPVLTFSPSRGSLTVTWPGWATNYWLEAAHDLSPSPAWMSITNTGAFGTNQFRLSPPFDAATFYRLRQQ